MKMLVQILTLYALVMSMTAQAQVLTVKGEATALVPPDFITVKAVIGAEDKNVATAKKIIDARANALFEALEKRNFKAADIVTSGVSVEPSYEYDRNDNEKIVGHFASRSIEIKLREMGEYESLVQEIITAGASVSEPDVNVDDENKLKIAALRQAALNARLKAEAIASALDVSVGDPVEIGEDHLSSHGALRQRTSDFGRIEEVYVTGSAKKTSMIFSPAPIEVSATVWISFAIGDGQP